MTFDSSPNDTSVSTDSSDRSSTKDSFDEETMKHVQTLLRKMRLVYIPKINMIAWTNESRVSKLFTKREIVTWLDIHITRENSFFHTEDSTFTDDYMFHRINLFRFPTRYLKAGTLEECWLFRNKIILKSNGTVSKWVAEKNRIPLNHVDCCYPSERVTFEDLGPYRDMLNNELCFRERSESPLKNKIALLRLLAHCLLGKGNGDLSGKEKIMCLAGELNTGKNRLMHFIESMSGVTFRSHFRTDVFFDDSSREQLDVFSEIICFKDVTLSKSEKVELRQACRTIEDRHVDNRPRLIFDSNRNINVEEHRFLSGNDMKSDGTFDNGDQLQTDFFASRVVCFNFKESAMPISIETSNQTVFDARLLKFLVTYFKTSIFVGLK